MYAIIVVGVIKFIGTKYLVFDHKSANLNITPTSKAEDTNLKPLFGES